MSLGWKGLQEKLKGRRFEVMYFEIHGKVWLRLTVLLRISSQVCWKSQISLDRWPSKSELLSFPIANSKSKIIFHRPLR
jgi:hypothetical protein